VAIVHGNMVRVAVTANGIKGNYHLRADLADMLHNLCRHFFHGLCRQCLRMGIIGRAGHARIAVIQKDYAF
jgi:hypothetical protein